MYLVLLRGCEGFAKQLPRQGEIGGLLRVQRVSLRPILLFKWLVLIMWFSLPGYTAFPHSKNKPLSASSVGI